MDLYDDTRHDHPSLSIPNAAYPDAPYRPGEGQRPHDDLTNPSSTSVSLSHPSSASGLPHHTGSSQWSRDASAGGLSSTRDDPPPPYAPRQRQQQSQTSLQQPAVTYSPLDGPSLAHHSPAMSSDGAHMGPMIPLQPVHSSASTASLHAPPATHHGYYATPQHYPHQQPHRNPQLQVEQFPMYAYGAGHGSTPSTMSGKPGTLEEARRRKKRRLKICVITMGVLFVFILAIILGVALTVFEIPGRHDSDGDDED